MAGGVQGNSAPAEGTRRGPLFARSARRHWAHAGGARYRGRWCNVTGNGCGYDDEPVVNGRVHDLHRREFLRAKLREMPRAIADDVPVRGYFLRSFMDHFDWKDDSERRFGIVEIDRATQRRTPGLSAHYYAAVLRENKIV